MNHRLIQLWSKADSEVRIQLETQFEIFHERITIAYQGLLSSLIISKDPVSFAAYHRSIFDDEFRRAFGVNRVVIIYLYRLPSGARERDATFGPIYIPDEWSGDPRKRRFVEAAVGDLYREFIDGEVPTRSHLFSDLLRRPRFSSEFIREIRPGISDSSGAALNISPEAQEIFQDEMLVITPLHLEMGVSLVTVNSYIDKQESLFARIHPDQRQLLVEWYLDVHQALAGCFLPAIHLLRFREERVNRRVAERTSALTYLLGHTYRKSFTTPLENARDLLSNALKRMNALAEEPTHASFRSHIAEAAELVGNIDLVTGNLDATLATLDAFVGKDERHPGALGLERLQLSRLRDELEFYCGILFQKRRESLLRDSELSEPDREKIRASQLSDWINLEFFVGEDQSGLEVQAHYALLLLHLLNFLSNSISKLRYREVWEHWGESGVPFGRVRVSGRTVEMAGGEGLEIVVEDNGEGIKLHSDILGRLSMLFLRAANGELSLSAERERMRERYYTTGHGGSRGISMLLAADYFQRIQRTDPAAGQTVRGNLSIGPAGEHGTRISIKVPIGSGVEFAGEEEG